MIPARLTWKHSHTHGYPCLFLASADPAADGLFMGTTWDDAQTALVEWNRWRTDRGLAPVVVGI